MDVASIMSTDPISAPLDMPVHAARTLMENEGIRHLPVLASGRVIAMLCDRDLFPDEDEFADARQGRSTRLLADVVQARLARVTPQDSLASATATCLEVASGGLPVMDGDELLGILSEMDLLRALIGTSPDSTTLPTSVDDVMTAFPLVATPATSVAQALGMCRSLRAHHLPVVDGEALVGIVSDRDLLCSAAAGRAHEGTLGEIMQSDPITVAPRQSTSEAAALMASAKISSLPVVDGSELVGIVTLTDLLEHFMLEHSKVEGGAT